MVSLIPMSPKEMKNRGWSELDFIFISGDAYVDHPSFGISLLARLLEREGYRVGIIAQPDWKDAEAFKVLGRPKLAFLISAGNMDSMVNHYTANKRRRREDSFSPGGEAGKRPDRATLVYTTMAKGAYKGVPVIIGGIEASLRRLTHYDYWSDKLRRSLLVDAKADLLIYGMAERALLDVASALCAGRQVGDIREIHGTVHRQKEDPAQGVVKLPSFEECQSSKDAFLESFKLQYKNQDPFWGKTLAEHVGGQWILQNPPAKPLSQEELDGIYQLSFTRKAHPSYKKEIPALREVQFSLTRNRGCYGACHFCALTFHQGRIVQTRSDDSLLNEVNELLKHPQFKGNIADVGGPTANFSGPACDKQGEKGACPNRECLFPKPCPNLKKSHKPFMETLRKLRQIPGVKKVFIRSGLRYDYLMEDISFIDTLCRHHVSGQLKVAPEHSDPQVLQLMGKPSIEVYKGFKKKFTQTARKLGKKYFLIPYLIASHPGSDLKKALNLALFLKNEGFIPDQVQDFYPTPGTLSTCMYYTGKNPLTGKTVYIPKGEKERKMQRAMLQFNKRENFSLVREALIKIGRQDLIGNGPHALVPPGRRSK